tara:strand:+ start:1033 stop:1158 length:126 start_codon:yes stop_codon:yes gene_type:complete
MIGGGGLGPQMPNMGMGMGTEEDLMDDNQNEDSHMEANDHV